MQLLFFTILIYKVYAFMCIFLHLISFKARYGQQQF